MGRKEKGALIGENSVRDRNGERNGERKKVGKKGREEEK